MIGNIVERFAQDPDIVRATVSDREGLLIAAVHGPAAQNSELMADDELWNACLAQLASNMNDHMMNLTLSQPREVIINGSEDDVVIVQLSVGWLIAQVKPSADWPHLRQKIGDIRDAFDSLTGDAVSTGTSS